MPCSSLSFPRIVAVLSPNLEQGIASSSELLWAMVACPLKRQDVPEIPLKVGLTCIFPALI